MRLFSTCRSKLLYSKCASDFHFRLFILLLVILLLITNTTVAVCKESDVHVRTCPLYTPRHITLAVGNNPHSEMIVTFASTLSNIRNSTYQTQPYAGIFLSTSKHAINNIIKPTDKFYNPNSSNIDDEFDIDFYNYNGYDYEYDDYENEYETNNEQVYLFVEELDTNPPTYYKVNVDSKISHANDGKKGGKQRYYCSYYYHHISMKGLQPNTKYYYRIVYHTTLQSLISPYSQYVVSNNNTITHSATATATSSNENDEYKAAAIKIKSSKEMIHNESNRNRNRQRKLIRWGPYDPSAHNCPDPLLIRYFRTAPIPGTFGTRSIVSYNITNDNNLQSNDNHHQHRQENTINIAIVGDIGQFPHSQETALHLQNYRNTIDTILLVGDLAYNEYDPRRWDTFLDFLDDYEISHYVPMQIVPGNHDIDKLVNDNNIFLAYEHRFRMPRVHPPILGLYTGNESGLLNMDIPPYPLNYEWGNAYYSYTYGIARIIMLSSYASIEPDSIQYNWVVSELQSINRTITPWALIILHTPMYNTFSVHHHDLQIMACKEYLEPLLVLYNVNLVFTGHIHAYLRTTNVKLDIVDTTGPVHITVGAGGRNCDAPFLNYEQESWVSIRDATYYGYGMLRIYNATHIEWEWIHTGQSDIHPTTNIIYHSNTTLPPGPSIDRIFIQNVYTM